jgi:hypothetical protein
MNYDAVYSELIKTLASPETEIASFVDTFIVPVGEMPVQVLYQNFWFRRLTESLVLKLLGQNSDLPELLSYV